MSRKTLFTLITFLAFLIVCFILGEILARILTKESLIQADERNLLYRYDAELGWFPIENSERLYQGSRTIQVSNNEQGFRDRNHGSKTKKRIAVIGDSFVWGYDVEQEERFTDKLNQRLPDFDVLNMGVSGYGTDQAYLLLQKWYNQFSPDIVILLFCENDWDDNRKNNRYGGYYKPYFDLDGEEWQKKGAPVPLSMNYYARSYPFVFKSRLVQVLSKLLNKRSVWTDHDPTPMLFEQLNDFVTKKGGKFLVGFVDDYEPERKQQLCVSRQIPHVFLGTDLKYPDHGNHWTPAGHDFVTEKIFELLVNQGIIEQKEEALSPS